jgi:hypothetical protein
LLLEAIIGGERVTVAPADAASAELMYIAPIALRAESRRARRPHDLRDDVIVIVPRAEPCRIQPPDAAISFAEGARAAARSL